MKNSLNYLAMSFKLGKNQGCFAYSFTLGFYFVINDCLRKYLFARTNMIRQ